MCKVFIKISSSDQFTGFNFVWKKVLLFNFSFTRRHVKIKYDDRHKKKSLLSGQSAFHVNNRMQILHFFEKKNKSFISFLKRNDDHFYEYEETDRRENFRLLCRHTMIGARSACKWKLARVNYRVSCTQWIRTYIWFSFHTS